jgi:hypothetical protein
VGARVEKRETRQVDLLDTSCISLYIRELNLLTDTLTKPVLRDEKRKLEKDMKQAKQDAKQARKVLQLLYC